MGIQISTRANRRGLPRAPEGVSKERSRYVFPRLYSCAKSKDLLRYQRASGGLGRRPGTRTARIRYQMNITPAGRGQGNRDDTHGA